MNHTDKRSFGDTESSEESEARTYVRHLRQFYQQALTFAILIPFLFIVNFLSSTAYWWAWWPTLGMGISLLFSALRLLSGRLMDGSDWEDRKVREIIQKRNRGRSAT